MAIALILIIAVFFLIIGPMITVLALSALGAGITLTFKTWLAALWLHIVFGGGAAAASRK